MPKKKGGIDEPRFVISVCAHAACAKPTQAHPHNTKKDTNKHKQIQEKRNSKKPPLGRKKKEDIRTRS
jgi:hypothetical protein